MTTNVLILGYGEMGHAMEVLLKPNATLAIWEKFPRQGFKSAVLEEAAPSADAVIFCLPAQPHQAVAQQVAPLLNPTTICISIAKGLDEQGRCAAQVFADVFADRQRYAMLYGPMISEEIRARRDAFAQVGCINPEVYAFIETMFAGSRLYLEHTRDVIGISWAVILKNVYALLFGMADGLQLGDNVRGYLAVAAVRELDAIVQHMGGNGGSAYNLAGLGDLITTATSAGSHHHELGRRLALGEMDDIEGEGVHTLQMVSQHNLLPLENYPLFTLVQELIQTPATIAQRLRGGSLYRGLL